MSNEKCALAYDNKTKSYISRYVHLHGKDYLMISKSKRYVEFLTFSADRKFVVYYKLKTIASMKCSDSIEFLMNLKSST